MYYMTHTEIFSIKTNIIEWSLSAPSNNHMTVMWYTLTYHVTNNRISCDTLQHYVTQQWTVDPNSLPREFGIKPCIQNSRTGRMFQFATINTMKNKTIQVSTKQFFKRSTWRENKKLNGSTDCNMIWCDHQQSCRAHDYTASKSNQVQ